MKLLLVSSSFPPDVYGSTQNQFKEIYLHARENYQTRLITGWHHARSLIPPEAISIQYNQKQRMQNWKLLYELVRSETKTWNPDIVLLNNLFFPRMSTPRIIRIQKYPFNENQMRNWIHKRWMLSTLTNKDAIVTTNKQQSQLLIQDGVQPSQLYSIPNGVSMYDGYPPRKTQKIHILCPASISPSKNQHIVIEAFARLRTKFRKRCILNIVGHTKDKAYLDRLRIQAYELPVRFILAPKDMKQHYQEADIVLLPGIHKHYVSLSAQEAMASGSATIWVETMCSRQFFHSLGVPTPPKDINRLVKILEDLIQNPERRETIGRELRAEAEKKYSWKNIWSSYEEILNVIYHKTWI
ncbi:MAG: glycosyltransferase family 4 protein [Myxococcota bacterium]|nr:glycosyltransferase family 4 protein [Myxococcota bacterium]